MASNPKIEFYKFALNPKTGKKSFKDFVIEVLGAKDTITNTQAFEECFKHFIKELESNHSKNEKKKKTITIIDDMNLNPFVKHKPTFSRKNNIISGVINGGLYDRDAIVSDTTDKKKSRKLGKKNSVLMPYFIYLYIPPEHNEGLFIVHSHSREESINDIFKGYIQRIFSGKHYKIANLIPYCPQVFQDEFREGAVIKNMIFETSMIDNIHSKDPFELMLQEYDIKIEAKPKNKRISVSDAKNILDILKKKVFGTKTTDGETLGSFAKKKMTAKNTISKKEKVFEWNTRDASFVPAVYLEGRVVVEDGLPDFTELKEYCSTLFEEYILEEIRPDLNVT